MSKILLAYRQPYDKVGAPITTYATSFHLALSNLGHEITVVGEGHAYASVKELAPSVVEDHTLLLDIDSGRNSNGNLAFQCQSERINIPSAVRLIDSHGHPSYHKRLAVNYDHVFFAVWHKRDLFYKHNSAHWCPNASDAAYFDRNIQDSADPRPIDIGFFGSKHGLDRADTMKEIAIRHGWAYDIREIGRERQKWPATAGAMAKCRVLFNKGQKHDGPNQRVIESMLMKRPLVTDTDKLDGMSLLFQEGEHYLGYESEPELANQLNWCLAEPSLAFSMANRAYELALAKHQVKNRVDQILEVCNVKD